MNTQAIDLNKLRTIITEPGGAETLVQEADRLGKELEQRGLSTSQIRAIFGEVRQIQAEWSMGDTQRAKALRKLILLKPKMAYRAQRERNRNRNKAVNTLVKVLDPAVDLVVREKDPGKQDENFQRFVEFFEAILAYHKAHGGN